MTPTELGKLDIDLGVSTTSGDPTPGNNTASATLNVNPPSDVTAITTADPSIEVGIRWGATSGLRF